MKGIVIILMRALAVVITSYVIPGVQVENFLTAIAVAVVLGILNTLIRPLLVLLTLPITVLTFGLFTLVINTLLIYFTSVLVPGFKVDSFLTAFFFGIVLSITNWFLNTLTR
ncbi:MAG: phage holin family protein [Candidatus Roizmanbacteria bacterium]|nr:phage holin family protein [Candidatus Roizmanbacteria bacterium]